MEFSVGEDDDFLAQLRRKFKPSQGVTYRASIGSWRGDGDTWDLTKPLFKAYNTYYVETGDAKFPLVEAEGHDTSEYQAILGLQPKKRVGFTMILWPIEDDTGDPDWDAIKKGKIEVWNWLLTDKSFDKNIWAKYKRRKLQFGKYDWLMTCTKAEFHEMDVTVMDDSILAKVVTEPEFSNLFERVRKKAEGFYEQLDSDFGQSLTPEQLRRKLSGQPAHLASIDLDDNDEVAEDLDNVIGSL